MTEEELFVRSGFSRWCNQTGIPPQGQDEELRQRALELLLTSINTGEITTLDGVESPLSMRIKAYHGLDHFEMNRNWVGTSQNWSCPCCGRSKYQLSRVGKQGQILAKLVIHHDHMDEVLKKAFYSMFADAGTETAQFEGKRLVERMSRAFAAYDEVLICEDCNNADTEAKKLVGTPADFSFSIGQIRCFAKVLNHLPHTIDRSAATECWRDAKPSYDLRMRLVAEVARAAATSAHWYEPHSPGVRAIPTFGQRQLSSDILIQRWVPLEALFSALAPRPRSMTRNLSRWRTESPAPGKRLPVNYLAILSSDPRQKESWDSVAADWLCPICCRSKEQVTYVGEKGKICFYLKSTSGRGQWSQAGTICNQCTSTLMSLKLEIAALIGVTPRDSYSIASPGELQLVIRAVPHSPHQIDASAAKQLLDDIVRRFS